jgi:class 3 adenylate cyclase/tetratricopeptide (TPR) repeat protein
MICTQCQSENSFAAIFCDTCGARLETACPRCGEPNRQGAKFCRNCGQLINHAAAAAAPPTVPGVPSPETYVPRHLAEKILASRQSLEGERKEVTVLFADIRGSTRLLEGLDPEDAQKLIDPVLRVMMDGVHRYEGTVNQVLGDGIMALFGAPLAHEDHAVRACYAALAMQEEMRRYRENRGQSEEHGLQISIGLNSGEVVVRSISNDLNVDYSALGHTTHLAARMQELAGAGAILLTTATLREVEGFVEVKSLGAVQAKGVSRPIDAYELVDATSARTRLYASVARGLTPFVGRKAEIETFQQLIEKSGAGHGQIFAMVGEPGMGKSRLVYEFTHSHVPPDWLVLEAPSVSYGKATPYFPVIELLRRYFSVSDADVKESIQAKVIDSILELDGTIQDTIPPILTLLGALSGAKVALPVGQRDGNQQQDLIEVLKRFNDMDPQQRRRFTFDALKRFVIRESQKQPLMLVFEDLHWIDNETQAFLDNLVESLPMARMLLLVNYRPNYSHNWAEKTYYTQLRVDPLQSTSAKELLQHLLGNNRELAPLKEALIQRTEGNPFFAEESVRSLVETGILVGEKGDYRPGLVLDSIRIPRSVQSVVADRIDRLPRAQKHLLQTAAVIGVVVPFRLLSSVAELPEEELYECLAKLQSAEFIYETNLFPEVVYSFKHALTTEVAYGALLHERRTFLHARIVKALEEMTGNTSHDHLDKLANHAYHGELWDKAVAYSREAGVKALSRSGFHEAVNCFNEGLAALTHLPQTHTELTYAVDLHFDLRNALFLLGEFGQALKHIEDAKVAAEALGDKTRLGQLYNFMTAHWNLTGESGRAMPLGEQAVDITSAPEDRDLHIVANYYLGVACYNTGRYRRAIEVLSKALVLIGDRKFERFGTTGIVSVIDGVWLARSRAQTGAFGDAKTAARKAVKMGEEAKDPYSLTYALFGLGTVSLFQGDFQDAIAALERGLQLCRAASIPVQVPLIASSLGYAYALSGQINEALQLLEQAVETIAKMKRLSGQPLRMAWLSEAYLLAKNINHAESLARKALELARRTEDRGSEAWILRLMGGMAVGSDSPDYRQAEAYYAEAFALARELEMRPVSAHCKFGLGNVYAAIGKIKEAGQNFSAAVELYRDMDMRFWLSQAQSALARLNA